MALEYIVPVTYSEENNYTYARQLEVNFKDCSEFNLQTICADSIWQYQKCGSDSNYCQPFVDGDQIYLQFRFDPRRYTFAVLQIFNSETDAEITGATTVQAGYDSEGAGVVNYVINTSDAVFPDCWYARLSLFKCAINLTTLGACIAEEVAGGETSTNAQRICALQQCDESELEEIITEPFCRIVCDQPSLLITGSYPSFDCDNVYYGDVTVSGNPVASIYRLSFRILGEVLHDGLDFIETIQNGVRTSVQTRKRYQVMGHEKLPPYVVNMIARAFGAPEFYIDGIQYQGLTKIDKNFEEGKSWILKTPVFTECDKIDTACE